MVYYLTLAAIHKTMATVAIVLNTTKKLTNDEYSVAIRVTHNRDKRYHSISGLITNQNLKFRCSPQNWRHAEQEDNGLGRFRKSVEGYGMLFTPPSKSKGSKRKHGAS